MKAMDGKVVEKCVLELDRMTPSKFKKARVSLDLTQVALGRALDKHRRTIGRYERGELPVPRSVELALRSLCADAASKQIGI